MLGKPFDPDVNHAEDVREYYRKQGYVRGRDDAIAKVYESVNELNDLNVMARMHMVLNDLQFDDGGE